MELKLEERIEELAERLVACWDQLLVEIIPGVILPPANYDEVAAGDSSMHSKWFDAFMEAQTAVGSVTLRDPETRKAAMLEVARFIARERLKLAGFDGVAS